MTCDRRLVHSVREYETAKACVQKGLLESVKV